MWNNVRNIFSLNDPGWGNKQGGNGSDRPPPRPDPDGPPDLDEIWRDFNRRLNGLFSKGRGGGDGGGPRGGRGDGPSAKGAAMGAAVLVLAALLLWLGSGFYIIQEGQSSIVLRFGQYVKQIDRAGFTWRLPYPIETNEIVDRQRLRTVEIGYRNGVRNKNPREALMLTQDQSIVDMQFAVQYRVGNPKDYLFNNNLGPVPEEIARQAAETAMREVVGRSTIDQVLYEEKDIVARKARDLIQSLLDRYGAGVTIIDVTIQQVQPPEQVQAAFEDANKAAQDRQRLINEGQAYANDVIPKAGGAAARVSQEADGYRQRIIAAATGDASRFKQVLTEYSKAPKVTRDRMYLETMQQVFSNVSKLYVESKSGGNLLYLPLDKLMQRSDATAAPGGQETSGGAQSSSSAASSVPADPRADLSRNRERPVR